MPLPRDLDTLRVPAFMRKRSLRASARKPLILTALDRKKAGLLPEALQKKDALKKPVRWAKTSEEKAPLRRGWPYIDMGNIGRRVKDGGRKSRKEDEGQKEAGSKKRKKAATSAPKPEVFSMPIVENVIPHGNYKPKTIGEMTHYYDKIKVGVIKLAGAVSVGDCITYDTEDGPYEQVIESMELDREPIFKAGRGKEIGLKLKKNPRIGCKVFK